jgi:hypothetical protein
MLLFALVGCGSSSATTGTYQGTLSGNYTDMDAPGPDGTGLNRTFQFQQPTTLDVTSNGLQLGTCLLDANGSAARCTLDLTGHDALALTDVTATSSFTSGHAQVIVHASGPRNATGMVPALDATFVGDKR